MRLSWIWIGGGLISGLIGAIAYGFFGPDLDRVDGTKLASDPWVQQSPSVVDVAALEMIWRERTPWGVEPKAPVPAELAPPPGPLPIAVLKDARGYRAVFTIHGAGQLALAAGGRLPDGGRLLSVAGLKVAWIDGDGQRHQREMFNTYQEEAAPR